LAFRLRRDERGCRLTRSSLTLPISSRTMSCPRPFRRTRDFPSKDAHILPKPPPKINPEFLTSQNRRSNPIFTHISHWGQSPAFRDTPCATWGHAPRGWGHALAKTIGTRPTDDGGWGNSRSDSGDSRRPPPSRCNSIGTRPSRLGTRPLQFNVLCV